MKGGEDVWRVFGKLERGHRGLGNRGDLRDDAVREGVPKLGDEIGAEVLFLLPQADEVLEFLLVLWAVVKGGGARDQAREASIPHCRKLGVAIPLHNMV